MTSSPSLKIINRSTTRPALDIDDLAQGGNIVVVKRARTPVVWVDADGVLHCASAIEAPGLGGGGTTFEYEGSEDGADIWAPAIAAVGFDAPNQNDALKAWISVIDAEGETWAVARANEEGWGISITRIAGTNSVPQAGTYTVLALWITSV